MPTTINMGLPLLEASQAQKHVTVNEAFGILDLNGIRHFEETLDLSVSLTTTLVFPDRALVIGVTARVTGAISGSGVTAVHVGDPGDGDGVAADDDRYITSMGLVLNSTGNGPVSPFPIYDTMAIQITGVGGTPNSGSVRLLGYYTLLELPGA